MRFFNLYWRTITERKFSWPIIASSVVLYILTIMGMYGSFANNPAINKLFEVYPKAVLSLLAGSTGGVDMFSPEGFVSIEFLQVWGMIIIAGFLMTTGASIVARDVDGHTMDLILTQPIDRVEYLVAKLFADITMMLALVAVVVVSLWAGTQFFDYKLAVDGIVSVGVLMASLYLMIECLAMALGVFFERGKAIIFSVVFLIGSHLLNSLGDLNETIKGFRWLSFFNYYRTGEVLAAGSVPWPSVLLFVGLALIFLVTAVVAFREKDIPA